jgi:predicted peptidase
MKSIKILMAIMALLSSTAINAQIKNTKTESVKIYGNCQMCEVTIERVGNVKNEAEVDWNKETKMATITYDANLTNPDEILKRIALAGYDSDQFLAPDKAYAMLSECCQYERINKKEAIMPNSSMKMESHSNHGAEMGMKNGEKPAENMETQNAGELQPVFDRYFDLKDALVQSDGKSASTAAKALVTEIGKVKMGELEPKTHEVWMVKMKALSENAEKISESTDADDQRIYFSGLSQPMYELMKLSTAGPTVYYQKCPMYNNGKGANWLSKESSIKNPYYGSMMMTCGSTVEKIN